MRAVPIVPAALVAALVVALLGATATPAAAGGGPDGGSLVAIGMGPAATLGGDLADTFTSDGNTGRIRLGGRIGRVGYELDTSVLALAGGGLERPGLILATPSLAYYPLAHPHAQLALRTGLGYGALTGEVTGPAPPCLDEPPCPGPTVETITHPAFSLDLGATFQLALGRRRGGRAVLWADLGVHALRVRIDGENVTGTAVTLTFGIGHGIAF